MSAGWRLRGNSRLRVVVGLALIATITYASYQAGRFSGTTVITAPDEAWASNDASSQAFDNLTASLSFAASEAYSASQTVETGLSSDKSYEYLLELLAASIEMQLSKGDPSAPEFTDWMSGYRKFLGDSPDARYLTAPVDASHDYELTFDMGDADYLGVVIYDTNPLTGWNRASDSLYFLAENPPQESLIRLASRDTSTQTNDQPSGYELQLSKTAHTVMVRTYRFNAAVEDNSRIAISVDQTRPREPVDGALSVERRLANTTRFFNETWRGSRALARTTASTANAFDQPAEVSPDFVGIFYPTPDNRYHGGAFDLAPHEHLVINGKAPDAAFWSVTLQNHWMQSLEPSIGQASLRGDEITVRDGRYRIWIGALPPPEGEDWLSTGGLQQGLVAIRYLLATSEEAPTARVISAKHSMDEAIR